MAWLLSVKYNDIYDDDTYSTDTKHQMRWLCLLCLTHIMGRKGCWTEIPSRPHRVNVLFSFAVNTYTRLFSLSLTLSVPQFFLSYFLFVHLPGENHVSTIILSLT